jgi:hypothetical protein
MRRSGGRRRASEAHGSSESDGEGGTRELDPLLPCRDETAIFRELGLAYVPPHMRYFFDWY